MVALNRLLVQVYELEGSHGLPISVIIELLSIGKALHHMAAHAARNKEVQGQLVLPDRGHSLCHEIPQLGGNASDDMGVMMGEAA
jgi:hypothetical protein